MGRATGIFHVEEILERLVEQNSDETKNISQACWANSQIVKGQKMRMPTKEKPEIYTLTDSTEGTIFLTDSGKFKANTRLMVKLFPGEKFDIIVKRDESIDFDTIEEAREYLAEKADEDHKGQFQG